MIVFLFSHKDMSQKVVMSFLSLFAYLITFHPASLANHATSDIHKKSVSIALE